MSLGVHSGAVGKRSLLNLELLPEPLIGFPKPRLAYFPLIYADKNLAHKLFLKE
jgi:hypothetical protein